MDVSVIIPCYRVSEYLPRFAAMLAAQTYGGSWEALFVDDGDESATEAYAALTDCRFRLLHQAHGGVSAARNLGLREARGEIVLFADPDDELQPEWMTTLVNAMEGVDLAWGGYLLTTSDVSAARRLPPDVGARYSDDAVRRRVWRAVFGYRLRDLPHVFLPGGIWRGCRRELVGLWCRAYRRRVIGDLRFDETLDLFEDSLFLSAYACRARTMRVVGDTGYHYFIRMRGAMMSETLGRMAHHRFVLRDARRRLDPGMTHWRGSYVLSAIDVARRAGLCAMLRYLAFKPWTKARAAPKSLEQQVCDNR